MEISTAGHYSRNLRYINGERDRGSSGRRSSPIAEQILAYVDGQGGRYGGGGGGGGGDNGAGWGSRLPRR